MGDSVVRWAKGFGLERGGTVLWLAHDGDTTRWCHQRTRGACPERRCGIATGRIVERGHVVHDHVLFVRAVGGQDQWVASGYLDRVAGEQNENRKPLGGDAGLDEEMLLVSGADVLTSYPFGDPMIGVEDRTGVPAMAMAEYAEGPSIGTRSLSRSSDG